MGEVTEKIYCCDRGDNDNALAAAIMSNGNRRDDWGPMAAITQVISFYQLIKQVWRMKLRL